MVVYLGKFFKYTTIFTFLKLNVICQLTMYTFPSVSFPTYLLCLITFCDENDIFVWLLYLAKANIIASVLCILNKHTI